MIELAPWDDGLAMQVLADIDLDDQLEAALLRGDGAQPLALFADWRADNAFRVVSVVALASRDARRPLPFALVGVMATGARGVAQAALVARDHRRWRTPLARLAVDLRRRLPAFAEEHLIGRIECRCHAGHPTAPALLTRIGFRREAVMRFPQGAVFHQFAWTARSAIRS